MRMFLTSFTGALMAASLTSMTMASSGPLIYAVNHQGHFPEFGDTLIRFNADAPQDYETVGSLGVANIGFGGLAFDGDKNLWAYATFNQFGGAASGLYSINLDTGQATVQGTVSQQTLNDLAWDPVTNTMYGVYTQGFSNSRLYSVNLQSGAVTLVGNFSGLDPEHNLIGLAIDSNGLMYLFDNVNKKLYVSDSQLQVTLLYGPDVMTCPNCEQAVGSQGIAIDWSRDNLGYHGAVGQGVYPNFYGTLNTFTLDGSSYVWGPEFGPNLGDGPLFPPNVQTGDLAIVPADSTPQLPGDVNNDGVVDISDMLLVMAAWGNCPAADACPADLNGDGVIDISDLMLVLDNWG